ncbi:hypothetical protein [Microvirga subterranea]|uniref:Uncharacterized protein n=1 Tax=Microvirga subterranea TaxID=186651 RepID=A0A370HV90_9HYPH|nr:hypothetical protein [Microvirga subterranea]RDI62433.1 hypothetical protein DES45_101703 [Microvirga subterranea]
MRLFTHTIAAAAMMVISQGPTLADCRSSDLAIPFGAVSNDAEKDTFGFACTGVEVDRTGSTTMRAPMHVMQVGPSTGDAEKDSWGYVQATDAP